MFYAKSIYQGGIEIEATEEISYDDYKNLGLVCPVCLNEVFYKNPKDKKPHFAHFKKSYRNNKECPLRVSQFSNQNPLLDILSLEGKGQRLEIFQKYFLNIINNTYTDFKIIIDQHYDFDKELEQECKEFINNKTNYIRELQKESDQLTIFQNLVTIEVIDYITQQNTDHLLKKIVTYVIYKNRDNLNSSESISSLVKSFLKEVDWLSSLINKKNKAKLIQPDINISIQQKEYVFHIKGSRLETKQMIKTKMNNKILYKKLILEAYYKDKFQIEIAPINFNWKQIEDNLFKKAIRKIQAKINNKEINIFNTKKSKPAKNKPKSLQDINKDFQQFHENLRREYKK